MSATWWAVLGGAAACYLTKLAGHRVPAHWLAQPRVARVSALVTVALLAALVGVQTFTSGGALVLDARVVALAVAAVALALRAPFIVVVILAAAVAALLRAVG
ncbi:AzlD domain-containing protein [Isoptericola sp. b441]|uniref:AzlD domain-containing protein n=1 Tax=Actinotalea lenta TaxID=3064654 RepID=A0ABT9D900_9CELL|nr:MULTISPECIES: AzlD domain-containing protein [unclassified Isoptericola]MDO8107371.1 AzlD domain-containing protein [Isoptericola sp. b441]MDO8120966.1 AzlD domain-containing protein [Isoptericola sp. b490]